MCSRATWIIIFRVVPLEPLLPPYCATSPQGDLPSGLVPLTCWFAFICCGFFCKNRKLESAVLMLLLVTYTLTTVGQRG